MKTYRVTGLVQSPVTTVVEAESPEQAREIAESRGMCGLMEPERLGYSDTNVWCHSGEIDGTPEITEVDEES